MATTYDTADYWRAEALRIDAHKRDLRRTLAIIRDRTTDPNIKLMAKGALERTAYARGGDAEEKQP